MTDHTLGDEPIEPSYIQNMQTIAGMLDRMFNSDGPDNRTTGFVLLVFPFGEGDGRCNYISNGADRDDIVRLFEDQIKRFKGLG